MTSKLLLLWASFSMVPFIWAIKCTTPGFVLSDDQNWCFAYSKEYKQWNQHSMICRMYGTRLVTLTDASKETQVQNFLTSQSIASTDKIYIGSTNIIGDGSTWIWSNVGDLSYTNWRSGHPKSTNRYNCLAINAGNPDYKWFNELCLRDYRGLCERPATAADRQ